MKDEVVNRIVDVASLTPHPRNYNAHSDGQIGDLRASLKRFGQVRSIVVQAAMSGKRQGAGKKGRRYDGYPGGMQGVYRVGMERAA